MIVDSIAGCLLLCLHFGRLVDAFIRQLSLSGHCFIGYFDVCVCVYGAVV